MTTLLYILMVLAPMALLITAFYAIKGKTSGKSLKKPLRMNLAVFAILAVLISVLSISAFADNEETAANRIEVYNKETKPLIDYYEKAGNISHIDGAAGLDNVFNTITGILGE